MIKISDYKETGMTVLAFTVALSSLIAAFSYKTSVRTLPTSKTTISVSGDGKVTGKPDIATITFTLRNVDQSVATAQKKVEASMSEIMKGLTDLGVAEKDIQVSGYNVYPKYSYSQIYCITTPCPESKPKLDGYDISETVTVKVRAIEKTGDVVSLLGGKNVTEFSGPSFTLDNPDAKKAEAKKEAITEARNKAEVTATSLGLHLGRLVGYSEDGSYPVPMYEGVMAKAASFADARGGATLPTGESTVTSSVTLTYEVW